MTRLSNEIRYVTVENTFIVDSGTQSITLKEDKYGYNYTRDMFIPNLTRTEMLYKQLKRK